jgi:UDP-N-acetylmuramoylalanine--D-glutamate ligase
MEDHVVYWADDPVVGSMMGKEGVSTQKVPVSLTDQNIEFHKEEGRLQLGDQSIKLSKLPFTGDHNYINCMCAAAVALNVGVPFKLIKEGLKSFHGIPHRMEYINTIEGVSYVNDSKATNVEAVFYALDAYPGPITWIAGGQDKGNDYGKIRTLVEQKVKALICLGVNNEKLKEAFGSIIPTISETRDIKEALQIARTYSKANDVVLLSPACASFDLFKNYEDRGDQFREGVMQLKEMTNKPSEI